MYNVIYVPLLMTDGEEYSWVSRALVYCRSIVFNSLAGGFCYDVNSGKACRYKDHSGIRKTHFVRRKRFQIHMCIILLCGSHLERDVRIAGTWLFGAGHFGVYAYQFRRFRWTCAEMVGAKYSHVCAIWAMVQMRPEKKIMYSGEKREFVNACVSRREFFLSLIQKCERVEASPMTFEYTVATIFP